MTIDTIIEFLQKLKAEKGNIPVSCDFRWHDSELYHNTELSCIFGDSDE